MRWRVGEWIGAQITDHSMEDRGRAGKKRARVIPPSNDDVNAAALDVKLGLSPNQ